MVKNGLHKPNYNPMTMNPLYTRAARYCSTAERCEQQVREHLQQWNAEENQIDAIIEQLQQENYLNAERFCKAFVHDKVTYQAWGRRKIQAALQMYHLPSGAIRLALQDIDSDVYTQQLRHLIEQKKGQPYEKIVRFLLQRGFEFSEINAEWHS